MNFGFQDLAQFILNETYSLEQNIINFVQGTNQTNNSTTLRRAKKILPTIINHTDMRIMTSSNHINKATTAIAASDVFKSATTLISDTYDDYWDDQLSSTTRNNYWSDEYADASPCIASISTPLTCSSTRLSALPGSADDWNNITVQFNQTWIQRTDWGEIWHTGNSMLVFTFVCALLVCLGLFRINPSES
ncbi:hypothetical protein WDU94_014980 [Cyamophila willieti]